MNTTRTATFQGQTFDYSDAGQSFTWAAFHSLPGSTGFITTKHRSEQAARKAKANSSTTNVGQAPIV